MSSCSSEVVAALGNRALSEVATYYYLGANRAGDGLVPAQLHLVGEEVEGVRTLGAEVAVHAYPCLLYTSPSPRDRQKSRMPSSA